METAKVVRCIGCPKDPWAITMQLHSHFPEVRRQFLKTYGVTDENGDLVYRPDYSVVTEFPMTAIETRMPMHGLQQGDKSGWVWKELDEIDTNRGATKAEIDAFRLLAIFVAHSDNKRENQRLVCRTEVVNGKCAEPFMIIQDMGANFGKSVKVGDFEKFDIKLWDQNPIWSDANICELKIKGAPNASFGTPRVSEAGRKLLAELLGQLNQKQIEDLFIGAYTREFAGETAVAQFVQTFLKRRSIIENTICP